jgi:hypothetical protein
MTNGLGKSDRPTVPKKFPNNAGQPAAEGMEGRGLAKGSLPQGSDQDFFSTHFDTNRLPITKPALTSVGTKRGARLWDSASWHKASGQTVA